MSQAGSPPWLDFPACPGVATVATHHRPGCAAPARQPGLGVRAQGGVLPRVPCVPLVCAARGGGACPGPEGYGSPGGGRPGRWRCRGGGGGAQQGGRACPTLRLAWLPVAKGPQGLFDQGRPGVCGPSVRFKGLVVCGSDSVGARATSGSTAPRVPAAAVAHHGQVGAPPRCLPWLAGSPGGVRCAQALGVVARWGGAPWVTSLCPPPAFLLGTPPGSRPPRARPAPWPSPLRSSVTCAAGPGQGPAEDGLGTTRRKAQQTILLRPPP